MGIARPFGEGNTSTLCHSVGVHHGQVLGCSQLREGEICTPKTSGRGVCTRCGIPLFMVHTTTERTSGLIVEPFTLCCLQLHLHGEFLGSRTRFGASCSPFQNTLKFAVLRTSLQLPQRNKMLEQMCQGTWSPFSLVLLKKILSIGLHYLFVQKQVFFQQKWLMHSRLPKLIKCIWLNGPILLNTKRQKVLEENASKFIHLVSTKDLTRATYTLFVLCLPSVLTHPAIPITLFTYCISNIHVCRNDAASIKQYVHSDNVYV